MNDFQSTMPLGELVAFVGGGTPSRGNKSHWDGNIPWASIKDLKGHSLDQTAEYISEDALRTSATNLIPTGTVIMATRVGLGKTTINSIPVAINQDLKALLPFRDNLNPRYLLFFLMSCAVMIERAGTGATVKGVTLEYLRKIRVPIPSQPQQARIVAILDAAEKLRCLREQADHRTIDLIPALFHEMFRNRDESAMKTLGEIVQSIDSGWSPVCRAESAAANEWGVLKLGAVTTGTYLDSENKALPEEEVPRPGIEVEAGDILFTRKNTKELVAAVAYVWETRPKLLLSDLIFRLRPKVGVGVESVYLAYALKKSDKRREIQLLASGVAGSMPNISKQRLSGIKVSLPPLSLQRAFAARVTGIRAMEVSQAASRRRLDDLFQSLLHRAFKGEL